MSRDQLVHTLELQGQYLAQFGEVALILDVPTPSGLVFLEQLPRQRTVFVTDNPCPKY